MNVAPSLFSLVKKDKTEANCCTTDNNHSHKTMILLLKSGRNTSVTLLSNKICAALERGH